MADAKDVELMGRALAQAARGLREGAMPIGAVLAVEDAVVAEAYWRGLGEGFLAHPEHVVLVEGDRLVSFAERRRATLYTTLEPCLMCVGAAMSFFLGRIVFAMTAPLDGASDVAAQWTPRQRDPAGRAPYARPRVEGGVREDEARELVVAWLETGVDGAEADFARRTLQLA